VVIVARTNPVSLSEMLTVTEKMTLSLWLKSLWIKAFVCLNGRCFDRETLRQLEKEPFSRKSFDVLDDPGYALFEAADRGDTALVGRLLAVPGIDVNAKDNRGMTSSGSSPWAPT
jgi:hypothetical protein